MFTYDDDKLENTDSEDISDVLTHLEHSFTIKYRKDAFFQARTFGDICDIIHSHISHNHIEDCTRQQAFYKVREAIAELRNIDKSSISPDSELEEFFPATTRRKEIRSLRVKLGIKTKILGYHNHVFKVLVISFLSSIACFFWDWKIAVTGLAVFFIIREVAKWRANVLQFQTMRELVEKITTAEYIAARRNPKTVNRHEITSIIVDSFSERLGLDKSVLTRDAAIS